LKGPSARKFVKVSIYLFSALIFCTTFFQEFRVFFFLLTGFFSLQTSFLTIDVSFDGGNTVQHFIVLSEPREGVAFLGV